MAIFTKYHHENVQPSKTAADLLRTGNLISFLLSVIVTLYCSIYAPTILHVSSAHPTPFTTNSVMTTVYWLVMFFWQVGFIASLWGDEHTQTVALTGVHAHFILFNLFHFAWVLLFVRHHFTLSELFLALNFINLLALYVRLHTPSFRTLIWVHLPVCKFPLAAIAIDLLHNGAIAMHCHTLGCRIFANVWIWVAFAFQAGLVVVFKDWAIGLLLAYQWLSLAIGQIFTKVVALQWIFGFAIAGILSVLALAVMIPRARQSSDEHGSGERAPLLRD
ncbi:hypothetical protein NEOLI_001033 [Neolecta irregularis DAH-3]|uniref:DUF1774-domain-containing protein n=1 Tax=Neolecta irregularis (strain DAH-3) TaxID=1198029 RepID=A0A1U7LGN2_NEOID|nr:hypothetical protein NEOLI_001033 [Neolecta irregularis DAH-3]|eukprot:OLL21816.1 hypothetical protein NEOLI_001033 [Neolecta irregularis DAH-3]